MPSNNNLFENQVRPYFESVLNPLVATLNTANANIGNAADNVLEAEAARDAAEGFRDSSLVNANLAQAAADDVAANTAYQDLSGINEDFDIAAIDGFIYDATQDADGGAAVLATGHPARAIYSITANALTIINGFDGVTVFRTQEFAGLTLTCVAVSNGMVFIGTTTGLIVQNIITAEYADAPTTTDIINHIAITIEDSAPIDSASGLPVPTLALVTDSGVSVINNNGTVTNGAELTEYTSAAFSEAGDLFCAAGGQVDLTRYPLWTQDDFAQAAYRSDASPALIGGETRQISSGKNLILAQSQGLSIIRENPSDLANGMAAHITADYNTGWMAGDIKVSALIDTAAGALTGISEDRSHNENHLTVVGSVTKTPVATGSEVMGFGGFSPANRFELDGIGSEVTFGSTGTVHLSAWVKSATTATQAIMGLNLRSSSFGGLAVFGLVSFSGVYAERSALAGSITPTVVLGQWQKIDLVYDSLKSSIYVDGELVASTAATLNLPADSKLVVGSGNDGSQPFIGEIAKVKLSNFAPTSAQIHFMCEQEKGMFKSNAQVTLHGTSSDVAAVHTEGRLIRAGTSAGLSTFEGLVRVEHDNAPVTTFVKAQSGVIVRQ